VYVSGFFTSNDVVKPEVEVRMHARVIEKWYEADERLASLGLTSDVLQEAARAGKLARAASTQFHPKWHAGNVMYSDALATLGELLAPDAWVREDPGGHPLVIHHGRKMALLVATSDENTGNGDASRPPSTRPAKGPRTIEAVEENSDLLFPDMYIHDRRHHPLDGYQFWWLLMNMNEVHNELRLELSRGVAMSKDRAVESWSERIMLAPQSLDDGGISIVGNPDDENGSEGGEYIVDVEKLG
jgi:hypothetical protein